MEIDLSAKSTELKERLEVILRNRQISPQEHHAFERDCLTWLNRVPDFAAFQFLYGTYTMHTDRAGLAINLFLRSMECGAKGPAPFINMGVAYKNEHNDEKAKECYEKAIALAEAEPDLVDGINVDLAHGYHGMASLYINAAAPDRCIYWCDKALALDPNDRFALWNKGLANLELGKWEEGFHAYDEAGFKATQWKPMERKLKDYGGLPKWDGTPGKTVIIYGEQGIGDEIMFSSMIPDALQQCKVIIDCDHRLQNLYRDSFPEALAVYPTSDEQAPYDWIVNHSVDAFLPMGSLGRHFRKTAADFPRTPFLKADPGLCQKWREILDEQGKGLKIGLSYAGGLKKTRADKRSILLEQFEPILRQPDCEFYSLQYHPWAADEAAGVGRKLGVPIRHWGDVVSNYDETAALVSELDAVISVNTSLIHLCGALGVPTLCLTPKYVAWRYGLKGPNPFYGSVNMLRQSDDGDWDPVIRKAAEHVKMLRRGKI